MLQNGRNDQRQLRLTSTPQYHSLTHLRSHQLAKASNFGHQLFQPPVNTDIDQLQLCSQRLSYSRSSISMKVC